MLFYQIALTFIPGIGDVLAKKLVAHCGSAEAVFREKEKFLKKIPRINESLVNAIGNREILERAERELLFIEKFRIRTMFFQDQGYPFRLRNCIDSPVMLYFKGEADLNEKKIIAVVGTRNATDYGKEVCHRLITDLSGDKVLVVSGLAYGIDSCAHRSSLDNGLPTLGVLGHGLDRIYPYLNKGLAERMTRSGGLLTDFPSMTKPDRENFPRRNRIIAGISDAIVVVEAATKGGALITADIANSYNRDVFAVPGRIGDTWSEGTNYLIRENKAALVTSARDIKYLMGWEQPAALPSCQQRKIFIELTRDEQAIIDVLTQKRETGIDELAIEAGVTMSKCSAALLNLEFEGIVRCTPGKVYSLA